jgi:hypothetical protein
LHGAERKPVVEVLRSRVVCFRGQQERTRRLHDSLNFRPVPDRPLLVAEGSGEIKCDPATGAQVLRRAANGDSIPALVARPLEVIAIVHDRDETGRLVVKLGCSLNWRVHGLDGAGHCLVHLFCSPRRLRWE